MIKAINNNISFSKNYAIVGHIHPDLDSVASSYATSYLAENIKTNDEDCFIPYCAGNINDETKFAFAHFGINPPKICENFGLKVSDIIKKSNENVCLSPNDSIEEFCKYALEKDLKTVPVVEGNKLKGIISRKDLAKFYFTKTKHVSDLKEKNVPYSKIAKLLEAQVLTGDLSLNEKIKGDVKIGAYSIDTMQNYHHLKDAIVVTGDREDLQLASIKGGAKAIIVTRDMEVSPKVIEEAKKNNTIVLVTKFDVTSSIKSLEQSLPIEDIMTPLNKITYLKEDDEIENIKNIVRKSPHETFPVLKDDGTFLGMVEKEEILNPDKKSFILVDHNAQNQNAKGIDEGEIVGIIDHHKIDYMPQKRINSTFGTTGATATIIAKKFKENNIEIPKDMAGLLWCAIISDTDKLTSNTTTSEDIKIADELACIAGIENMDKLADTMLAKREFDIENSNMRGLIEEDSKIIPAGKGSIFISQIKTSQPEKYLQKQDEIKKTLNVIDNEKGYLGSFAIITDYIKKNSYVISSNKAEKQAKTKLLTGDDFKLNTKITDSKTTFKDVYEEIFANSAPVIIKGATSRKEQFQPFMTKMYDL